MAEFRSLDELRTKAHKINCVLVDEDYDSREIERIAASYLSYHTHKELADSEKENVELSSDRQYELYGEYL
jgi:hypothetical protein